MSHLNSDVSFQRCSEGRKEKGSKDSTDLRKTPISVVEPWEKRKQKGESRGMKGGVPLARPEQDC